MVWRSPTVMLCFWTWKWMKMVLQSCNRYMDVLYMMFGSKRPRNARVKWKFEVLGQNIQQWWFVMQFWVWGSFGACVFVGSLSNSVSIYREKVLRFEMIRNKESYVMSPWLVFEGILTNMVSIQGTCLVVASHFKHVFSEFIEYACEERTNAKLHTS